MSRGKNIGERVKAMVWAVCAIVLAAAMLFVCSTPAVAEDSTQGTTAGTGTESSTQTTQGQSGKTDASGSSTDAGTSSDSTGDSDSSQAANGNNGAVNSSSANDTNNAPAAAADGECAAVADWDTLVRCVTTDRPADGMVAINAAITAPADSGSTTLSGDVTLTAAASLDSVLTATSAGDPLFTVDGNHTLTIGKSANDASFSYKNSKRSLAGVKTNGTLTINNGTFDNINTLTNYGNGSVVNNNGGTVTINGGTFSNNSAVSGGVLYQNNGSTTAINGGTFTNNVAGSKGGVIHSNGTLTIAHGTFTGNVAKGVAFNEGGGAISQDQGSTTITGGDFTGNKTVGKANYGGGAILMTSGTMTITGGTFTGNKQTFEDADGNSIPCTNDALSPDTSPCLSRANGQFIHAGGGAIRITGGAAKSTLIIRGGVTFSQNYSRAYGWGTGGGAIYVEGKLFVYNDSRGVKPKFDHNWAGIYDTQYVKDANGKEQVPKGGAGGAIFLQDGGSEAYLMGGSFTNNSSGYLGGAIYTEERSTTYVAKAVAHNNTAGHFGGGLWLCPSGVGETSKGGNIALFDNEVDKSIDPNPENQNPADVNGVNGTKADGTEAGDDFAIMNPYHKLNSGVQQSSFVLMDTWFTDRTETAVTWYRDGIPVRDASGYDDHYQNAEHKWNATAGTNIAVTKSDGRYAGQNDAKIDNLVDHMKNLTLGWNSSTADFNDRGIALKAEVTGTAEEQAAKKSAAITAAAVEISGNKARLSGGGFGTNGNVKFSTPYTASWTKVDSKTDTKIGGATWTLTTTGTGATKEAALASSTLGGPFNTDFTPSMCAAGETGETAWENGTCWKQEAVEANGQWTVTNSMRIIDNQGGDSYLGVDNNPDAGGFDINNLHNGTYTLTETSAPTGYAPETNADGSAKTYTFTVNNAQAQWNNDSRDTTVDKEISNTRLKGVSWGKIDADSATALGGSAWTVTQINKDGSAIDGAQPHEVTDCVDSTDPNNPVNCEADNKNKPFADTDGTAGKFNIIVDKAKATYKLVEKTSPSGYWMPTESTWYRFFSVDANSDDKVQIYKSDGTTEVPNNDITNTLPNVAWSKVAKDNTDELLSGSKWTLYGPLDSNGDPVRVNGQSIAVIAKVVDCESENNYCDTQSNDLTGGADGKGDKTYADVDRAAGQLKVKGLAIPSDASTEYTYELTETKAPQGYVLSRAKYQFTVGYALPDAAVGVCKQPITGTTGACTPVSGNKIINVRAVAALPLTGGTARDWLLIGGLLIAGAGLLTVLMKEYRKRNGIVA
ncbi:hypothetical protein JS530_01595 [Bifidobacterium sp. LC6]|uniref:SpaA-like prealbumin fold domain-containing protein n=1 Tax=Bifidobacterium colobi TaxID=2809026 RepID=A0ABS5UT66_9BIFI|nr:SpaA isopeptide-forming pilin-related protein [Bifidobacterium colobi]MBT1174217.1 hypothetical protein [Bifidobacterium colobi]